MNYDYILSVRNEELNLSYSFPVSLCCKMQDLLQKDIDFLQEVENKKGTFGLKLAGHEDIPLRAPTAPLAVARLWDPVVLCGSGFCRTTPNTGFQGFRSALYEVCAFPANKGATGPESARSLLCTTSCSSPLPLCLLKAALTSPDISA